MAGRDAAEVPAVFSSAHGDIAISDGMCTTLAGEPLALSPTRFHNSVHNAQSGYWTVATRCHAPSSALTAWAGSFAAGLLEAGVQAHADGTPVLFVASDAGARGALAEVVGAGASFGVALLLGAERGPRTVASLRLRHEPDTAPPAPLPPALQALAAATPVANALPLFALLAAGGGGTVRLPAGVGSLAVEVPA
jgi:hypothetical protein